MTRRARLVAAAATALLAAAAAMAAGTAPLRPGTAPPLPGTELVLTGENRSPAPLALWVRVDGPGSRDFASRANLFRAVAPGRFTLRLNAADLVTPGGAPLALGLDPAVRVFAHDGAPGLGPVDAAWEAPQQRPAGIVALDFGPPGAPVFPGFDGADATHPALAGARLSAVLRPGEDALARDGVAGVESVTLSVPPGRYRVKLWLDDLGAWEYLPHALRQRVRLNGRTVLDRTDSPESFLEGRWLAQPQGTDPWTAFGARRAGLAAETVEIGPGGLRIELAGDRAGALFLAAVAVVPEAEAGWLGVVAAGQADRFRAAWPVDPAPARAAMDAFRTDPAPLVLAPGQTGFIRVDGGAGGAVTLVPPTRAGRELPTVLHGAARRLDRPSPLAPVLSPLARVFEAGAVPESDPLGRPILVAVAVPGDSAPGPWLGAVTVGGRPVPLRVDVVAADLPPSPPTGVYLADPPHHRWFGTDPRRDRACRLATLARLGLTAVAPPLDASTPGSLVHDLGMAQAALGAGPHLAYQALPHLMERLGTARALAALPALHAAAPGLLWAVADEPANPGPHGRSLAPHLDAIRAAAPGIRLAGQLNAPADRDLARRLDVALVNPGYGIAPADFAALRAAGVEGWTYNTGPERLIAGLWGWHAGATGHLAWHAMMPTAHPFDPTDGREGDALLMPPVGDPCAANPALDDRLAALSEGAADRRWLLWLDDRAGKDTAAAALRTDLLAAMPATWDEARTRFDAAALDAIRAAIAALARPEG